MKKRTRWPGWLGATLLVVSPLALGAPSASGTGTWQTLSGSAGGACHSGGVSGWSAYTWCWGKQKLTKDGDSSRDNFSWRMTLSGNATNGKHIKRLWVEPFPRSGSPAQHWRGTDPFMPDHTVNVQTNCSTTTTSVGGGDIPFTYSTSQQTCDQESFGPKLYTDPGHHAGIWSTNNYCNVGTSQVRKVYATMTVWVAQGKVPLWDSTHHGADAKKCL
jgi:hypothetical protein